MRRTTAALATLALAGGLLMAAPAHADAETDSWTSLDQCIPRYHRVVSIADGLAHQNSVLTDERDALALELEESQEKVAIMRGGLREQEVRIDGLYRDIDELSAAADRLRVRVDRQRTVIERKNERLRHQRAVIRRLRARH